jgi:hypothetical protein
MGFVSLGHAAPAREEKTEFWLCSTVIRHRLSKVKFVRSDFWEFPGIDCCAISFDFSPQSPKRILKMHAVKLFAGFNQS